VRTAFTPQYTCRFWNCVALKVPCAPKRFDFEFPRIKTTKLLVVCGGGGGCAGGDVPLGAGPCCPDVGRCLSGVNIGLKSLRYLSKVNLPAAIN